jgi:hypothetical protein
MTTYKGNSGVVKISTNAIAELTGFTITETGGTAEDTALGDAARTYVADDLPTWTATINGHWFLGDTNGQALIVIGASLALSFNPHGTSTGAKKLDGTGIITQVQHGEVANGQIIPFSAQVQGTGALTRGAN